MSMYLQSAYADDMVIGLSAWGNVLELAVKHGWQPVGTQPPYYWSTGDYSSDVEWPGSYEYNDQQVVTAPDAAALAEALSRALEAGDDIGEREFIGQFIELAKRGAFTIG